MLRRLLGRVKSRGGHGGGALPPLALTPELVASAIEAFGQGGRTDRAIEADVLALAGHPLTARRLLDVIPEAFGLVLVAHIPACAGMALPNTFSARTADGEWRSIPCEREPLFALAAAAATRMYHDGPRDRFRAIASRASIVNAVSQALDQVDSLEGGSMGDRRSTAFRLSFIPTDRLELSARTIGSNICAATPRASRLGHKPSAGISGMLRCRRQHAAFRPIRCKNESNLRGLLWEGLQPRRFCMRSPRRIEQRRG